VLCGKDNKLPPPPAEKPQVKKAEAPVKKEEPPKPAEPEQGKVIWGEGN
jgi:hypothetical protein